MKNILLTCFSLFVIVAFTSCSLTMNKNEPELDRLKNESELDRLRNESELDRLRIDDFKISFNPSFSETPSENSEYE